MIPAKFDYTAPETLDEAVGLLERLGEEAKILTGGHSLIPMLKLRLAQPGTLVDLRKIDALRGIRERDGGLEIGASATHAEIAASQLVQRIAPVVCETAGEIGDRQVRNAGTIGGAVVHADPAADWPAALLATGATVVLRGSGGERTVAAQDFFVGLLESAARPGEILTAIRIPAAPPASGAAYRKIAQSASGFALAGVAVQLTLDGDTIGSARVGITGVADHAYRPAAVESALAGSSTDEDAVRAASAEAAQGLEVLEDIHAGRRYRTNLAQVLTRRAALAAVARARA